MAKERVRNLFEYMSVIDKDNNDDTFEFLRVLRRAYDATFKRRYTLSAFQMTGPLNHTPFGTWSGPLQI